MKEKEIEVDQIKIDKIADSLKGFIETLEIRRNNKVDYTAVPSGLEELDNITGGWKKGELIVVGARPSMGKTSFLLSSSWYMSSGFGKCVAYFSLEQSTSQVIERLVSLSSQISVDEILKGKITDEQFSHLQERIIKLAKSNFYISDIVNGSLEKIIASAKYVVEKFKVDIILIDYLQLIQVPIKKSGNRESVIAEVMRSLSLLAKELKVPIIITSQLSRAVETRGGVRRPLLSDLRESGSIEQDADKVLFIYRPEYYGITEDEEGNSTFGLAEIIIAKNRTGRLDTVKLKFINRTTLFTDYEFVDTSLFKSL